MEDKEFKGAYTLDELRFAAYVRCRCGAGYAYPKWPINIHGSWICSALLLKPETLITIVKPEGLFGGGVCRDSEGQEHDQALPFAFFEIKSDDQPSAMGATTRPGGIVPTQTVSTVSSAAYMPSTIILDAVELVGCDECRGVDSMELPLSGTIKKVNFCPMCRRKF